MDRRCSKCGEVKPLDEFTRARSKPHGRDYICLICTRVKSRLRREKNPEAVKVVRERYRERHPRAAAEASRRWRTRNPEKVAATRATPAQHRAHMAVQRALRSGKIIRPSRCERCGKKCKPHAHHEDYSKPLEVNWWCPSCHKNEHLGQAA